MFANLIESQSHGKEFKRRGRFVIATVAAYTVLFFAAGIVSILAYDARLEAQTNDLELINWVPPVTPIADRDRPQVRRPPASTNTSRTASQPVRPVLYETASNPHTAPDLVSVVAQPIPPAPPNAKIGSYVADPVLPPGASTCITCKGSGAGPTVPVESTAPPPVRAPVKPPTTQNISKGVLMAKVVSLPQPIYPQIAKQIRIQGSVNVQILVDEQGKVISAQAVSGHPMLTVAAKDAAMRARFTPTLLSGQPVKVQGVITYNFVLQ